MNPVELECPMCGKLCRGEILNGYPDCVTIECERDGYQAKKLRNQRWKVIN